MYRHANRVIEMRPEAFWTLTPSECAMMIEGASSREERAWDRAALIAAMVYNMAGKVAKKQMTPAELLGKRAPIRPVDPGAKIEELRARLERMAEQAAAERGD